MERWATELPREKNFARKEKTRSKKEKWRSALKIEKKQQRSRDG